jgi:hypothetical protein
VPGEDAQRIHHVFPAPKLPTQQTAAHILLLLDQIFWLAARGNRFNIHVPDETDAPYSCCNLNSHTASSTVVVVVVVYHIFVDRNRRSICMYQERMHHDVIALRKLLLSLLLFHIFVSYFLLTGIEHQYTCARRGCTHVIANLMFLHQKIPHSKHHSSCCCFILFN